VPDIIRPNERDQGRNCTIKRCAGDGESEANNPGNSTSYLSSEIKNQENLIRLKELQDQGYSTVYLYDHVSARDPIQILKLILDNKLTQNREICFPIEARLYNNSKSILEPLAKIKKIKLCPLVTQASLDWFDSQQKNKYEKAERSGKSTPASLNKLKEKQILKREKLAEQQRELNAKYFKTLLDVIGKGGSAVIALQATRKEWFEMPAIDGKKKVPPVVDTLIVRLDHDEKHNDAHKYKVAFSLIAPSIKGETDYKLEKTGFFNPDKKYILNIGPTFTRDELKPPLLENDERKKTSRYAGKKIYEEFDKIVSPERKKPSTA
jgi:hypothetical protein